jgi:hypothetical protein
MEQFEARKSCHQLPAKVAGLNYIINAGSVDLWKD